MKTSYTFIKGFSPLVATAIHDGHETRDELADLFNLEDKDRLREEDPFTAKWLEVSDNNIIVHHSRFETDVNRSRDKAVYVEPGDAWGLQVWKNDLPEDIVASSLTVYDNFYKEAKRYFDSLFDLHDFIVVYDIHSYNHRRESTESFADPVENPEINIGTKNMDRDRWRPLVQQMIKSFSSFDYDGRYLDVRENIKFKGGYFGEWLYKQYGKNICPVSIEFKKFFMDEWTGKPFDKDIKLISDLLVNSRQQVLEVLKNINT
ncbi:MAG: N-formylglutamate amidohydrolase [Ginsengibacter sp.]